MRSRAKLVLVPLAIGLVVLFLLMRDASKSPPTVLLVVWEGVATERLAPYGGAAQGTPELARLAQQSLVFHSHLPSSDGLNAALASLLTSKSAREHGVGRLDATGGGFLAPEHRTLAERFAAAGYRCFASFASPRLAPELSGLQRGFERCEAPAIDPLEAERDAGAVLGALRAPLEEALGSSAPVFALLHFGDASSRTLPRSAAAARLVGARLEPWRARSPEVEEALRALPLDPAGALSKLAQGLLRRRGDPLRTAFVEALHDARLAEMDAALGELLRLLEKRARRRSAVIALCGARAGAWPGSPPSEATGEPPASFLAPFLLCVRDGALTGRSFDPTSDLDLGPTLLAAVGLEPPRELEAFDLQGIYFEGVAPQSPRALAWIEDERFARRGVLGQGWFLGSSPREGLSAVRRLMEVERLVFGPSIALDSLDERPAELESCRALLESRPPLGRLRFAARAMERNPRASVRSPSTQLGTPTGPSSPGPLLPPASTRSFELSPSTAAELAWTRLDAEGRRPDLAIVLASGHELDERLLFIGGTALSELDLALFPSSSAPPWPSDADGRPFPQRASIARAGGIWSEVRVEGESGESVSAIVELLPLGLDPLADVLELGEGTRLSEHPRRAGAVVLEGPAPLVFRLRHQSGASAAFAFFAGGERVRTEDVRYEQRCFSAPGTLDLCLTAAAWSDPALRARPSAVEKGVWIELEDPTPPAAPRPLTKSQQRALRLLDRPE